MAIVPFVLLVVGGGYLIASVVFIVYKESKWWTGFGAPLGLLGLTTSIIGLFGLVSDGFLVTRSVKPNILSFFAYLIPLFVALYAIFWFLFASRYVGLLSSRYETILGIIAGPLLLAMPLGTTWTYLDGGFVDPIGMFALLPDLVLQLSGFFVAPLHFGIALVGVIVLVWGVYQYPTPSAHFVAALFVSGPIWYFASYVSAPVFGLQSGIFQNITAVTSVVGLAGVWWVYSSGNLIEQRPKASSVGRNTVIQELEQPVLVIDRDWNVSDINVAALDMFGSTEGDILGTHISELLPERVEDELSGSADEFRVRLGNNRKFHIRVSTVSSGRGTVLGKTLIFHDVTEQERRKQQIQVLNRVLRHNLRNEGTAVIGYANIMQDSETYDPEYMAKLTEGINELVQTGHRAQEVERMMSADRLRSSPTTLSKIIDQSIETLRPDIDIDATTEVPEYIRVVANEKILGPMVTEALRNAVIHGGDSSPRVVVSEIADEATGEVVVSIEDDGPGIPDEEVAAIRKGEEDPLEHGSGLGLWLLHWGGTKLGGSVRFTNRDGVGTAVRIYLPADTVRIPGTTVPEMPRGNPD